VSPQGLRSTQQQSEACVPTKPGHGASRYATCARQHGYLIKSPSFLTRTLHAPPCAHSAQLNEPILIRPSTHHALAHWCVIEIIHTKSTQPFTQGRTNTGQANTRPSRPCLRTNASTQPKNSKLVNKKDKATLVNTGRSSGVSCFQQLILPTH
jgi:hypothetical protein